MKAFATCVQMDNMDVGNLCLHSDKVWFRSCCLGFWVQPDPALPTVLRGAHLPTSLFPAADDATAKRMRLSRRRTIHF